MADITAEIDLDSVIDRLLEGELASPKKRKYISSSWPFEMFLWSGFFLSLSLLFFFVIWDLETMGVLALFMLHLMMWGTTHFMWFFF
jgi:hypothetical protein